MRRYELDTIKIGRSFVAALETKVATSEFAAALLSVGKNLGLNVLRERAPMGARKAVLPLGMGKLVAWPQLELARSESPLVSKH